MRPVRLQDGGLVGLSNPLGQAPGEDLVDAAETVLGRAHADVGELGKKVERRFFVGLSEELLGDRVERRWFRHDREAELHAGAGIVEFILDHGHLSDLHVRQVDHEAAAGSTPTNDAAAVNERTAARLGAGVGDGTANPYIVIAVVLNTQTRLKAEGMKGA